MEETPKRDAYAVKKDIKKTVAEINSLEDKINKQRREMARLHLARNDCYVDATSVKDISSEVVVEADRKWDETTKALNKAHRVLQDLIGEQNMYFSILNELREEKKTIAASLNLQNIEKNTDDGAALLTSGISIPPEKSSMFTDVFSEGNLLSR